MLCGNYKIIYCTMHCPLPSTDGWYFSPMTFCSFKSMTSHVELRQTLMSVSANCHLIERLFFESSKTGTISFLLDASFGLELFLFFLWQES